MPIMLFKRGLEYEFRESSLPLKEAKLPDVCFVRHNGFRKTPKGRLENRSLGKFVGSIMLS